jgi:polyisoprenyl-phosphate glycosyltransferase
MTSELAPAQPSRSRPVSMPEPSSTVPRPNGQHARPMLSVVVPMLNEERGIGPLVARLRPVLESLDLGWEVIFVDDGSTDGTLSILRALQAEDQRMRAISLSRNFGKEIATAAGLSYVAGDAAVIMDADLQHPPELIVEFVKHWRAGYDVVYGQRLDRTADTVAHRLSARVFYVVFQALSGTVLPENAGDFRLLDRKAVNAMNRIGERVRFNKGLFAWMGFRSLGVRFPVPPRANGASRWRPRQLLRFAIDGIASFTTVPLRVWSYLGLVISVMAICYAMVFLIKTLLYGTDVPGFPTLVISVMFFAGVQLISLGVIGEYLGRVYEEVKGRPLFLVAEELGIERERTQMQPAPNGDHRR